MGASEKDSDNIYLALTKLIELKAARDNIKFTPTKLANAIGMPHSMVVKIAHEDPTKRVKNPRIDTLVRIIEYFQQQGFDVTIEDVIRGLKDKHIDVKSQPVGTFSVATSIPVYSMDASLDQNVGMIDVKLTQNTKDAFALVADEDINPLFKKGAIFVVDTTTKPENDTLVAAKVAGHDKIIIRKLQKQGHKTILKPLDGSNETIELMPTSHDHIVGVVIQVNVNSKI